MQPDRKVRIAGKKAKHGLFPLRRNLGVEFHGRMPEKIRCQFYWIVPTEILKVDKCDLPVVPKRIVEPEIGGA